ncbi:hypothetical protein HPB51_010230 [Rhipicephalus microplus]|uniref:Uncharacterized protein n=1 Tax=Rhipicephalus microplus TaxID=6941 RepID=A0A9J6F171_RHIMP|nr:hypothetical protein HPB51_010230 [Rhipicephalus microplus]
MSECSSLESIPEVKLDNGRFKYVLIKVHDKTDPNRSKLLVRGSASATYHADIYEREMSKIESNSDFETECLGGGRIIHNPDCGEIKVFGYSQGYGQADHSKAVEILKRNFPDYKSITWFAFSCAPERGLKVLEKETAALNAASLECECLGGGYIIHIPDTKELKVYGNSQTYGQADHAKTTEILKKQYPTYSSITWSNDAIV